MTKEGISVLDEKITVLTNCITTLNESLKNDRLMRLMMIKKQCEDVSMPLGCVGLENGSHKDKLECVLEEEHMEVSLTSFEPKYVCVETQHEEVVSNEPEIVVGVEEVESLKVSSLDEPRQESIAAGVLMCTCEGCVREFEDHKDDELLGFEVGQGVTMMGEEKQKVSYVQNPEVDVVLKYHVVCWGRMLKEHFQCHLNKVLGGCTQGFFAEIFERKGLRNFLELQLGRNCKQRGVYQPNLLICFYLNECDLVFELLIPWVVTCEENEFIRRIFEPFRVEYMGIRQWVRILIKYALTWFEWLNMKGTNKGRSFCLIWSCGSIVLMCVGGEKGSEVAVIHRRSCAYNDSSCKWRVENQLLVTVRMQLWDCHGEMFKVQSKAAQSIGKWFHIAELDVKSKGDRLKHIADAQVSERATEIERFRLKDLKHKPLIREAVKMGMRTEYQDFVPLHSNTINCMMKSTQSSSHKIHLTQLILLNKLIGVISFDAREIELVMIMLKWGAKNAGIKRSIAEPLVLKAKSVKTIKSVIEWMIAWEKQSVLSS